MEGCGWGARVNGDRPTGCVEVLIVSKRRRRSTTLVYRGLRKIPDLAGRQGPCVWFCLGLFGLGLL